MAATTGARMKRPVDPIAEAWKQSHKTPLPPQLQQANCQRAGYANAVKGKIGKGKHTLAVCVWV